MTRFFIIRWLPLAVLCGLVSTDGMAAENTIIRFALMAGNQPLHCDAPAIPMGRSRTFTKLKDAKFYLYDFRLIKADGTPAPLQLIPNDWQSPDVAFLDFVPDGGSCRSHSTGAINNRIQGILPAGVYRGISFTIGVPLSRLDSVGNRIPLNHGNFELAESPLDRASMAWSWQAGRKFIKLELLPEGGIQREHGHSSVWALHLGSTGCSGNVANPAGINCSSPNRVQVSLPDFDPTQDHIAIDADALLADTNLSEDKGGASGCMSSAADPECLPVFRQLQLGLPPGNGSGLPVTQTAPHSFLRVVKP